MAQPLPIKAINHLGVTTLRVEESKRFYRDVLGFREVARPNFDFAGSWLFNYGIVIHLIYSEASFTAQGEIQTRDNHLALHVDDLDQVECLLKEHGIAYRKNEIADSGIKQIFFHDPDGHHIEVGKYPPTPEYI